MTITLVINNQTLSIYQDSGKEQAKEEVRASKVKLKKQEIEYMLTNTMREGVISKKELVSNFIIYLFSISLGLKIEVA